MFQEFEVEIEGDLDRFHSLPEFPRFYYFFKKLLGACKKNQEYHHKSQFLWENAQKIVDKNSQYYPSLIK